MLSGGIDGLDQSRNLDKRYSRRARRVSVNPYEVRSEYLQGLTEFTAGSTSDCSNTDFAYR